MIYSNDLIVRNEIEIVRNDLEYERNSNCDDKLTNWQFDWDLTFSTKFENIQGTENDW